jgi:hypothetical protein
MIKSIFILGYKREKIFFSTLKRLKKCKYYDEFKKLVVFQDISEKTIEKIKRIDHEIDIVQTKYKNNISAKYKISNNSYLGFKRCFENYKSEYVIFLEDDILPSYDFLQFHNDIIMKYRDDKKFFAVNSFSKEYKKKRNMDVNFIYSKFIYGIGQGWSIPSERWLFLKKMYEKLLYLKSNIDFDAYFEQDIKRKYYVIMPYRSRVLAQPSDGHHFKISDTKTTFYEHWKKSFLDKKEYEIKKYNFILNMKYTWRQDCLKYNIINVLKTNLKLPSIKKSFIELLEILIGYKQVILLKKNIRKIL